MWGRVPLFHFEPTDNITRHWALHSSPHSNESTSHTSLTPPSLDSTHTDTTATTKGNASPPASAESVSNTHTSPLSSPSPLSPSSPTQPRTHMTSPSNSKHSASTPLPPLVRSPPFSRFPCAAYLIHVQAMGTASSEPCAISSTALPRNTSSSVGTCAIGWTHIGTAINPS